MPGVATAQLLTYAEIVDVDLDATNDVNFADVEDYGHRVQVELGKGPANNYLHWNRAVGIARPSAQLNALVEASFKNALIESLNTSYVDIDGVSGGLHFGTANLSTNPDPRIRKNGAVSANDIPLCFVLYKLYGASAVATLDNIYNMADAYDMLSSSTVATAIVESFKAQESGALDTMFRDLLSSDPHRFFNDQGLPEAGIFETNGDVAGHGTWKLTEGDILEVKLKMIFHSRVTRRGVAGREHNLTTTATENATGPQENQQTVIEPEDYFYIRLQIKIVSGVPTADASKLLYQSGSNETIVTGYNGNLVGELTIPDGVVEIANNAFNGDSGLIKVNLPSSLITIGANAFQGTGLLSINLNMVRNVGAFAFLSCTSLVTVSAPEVLVFQDTFYNCSALETITMPKVQSLTSDWEGYYAGTFRNCTKLNNVVLPNTLTSIVSNGYKAGGTFANCTSLTSLVIPNSVTSIQGVLCYGCTALSSVTLPTTITAIPGGAFTGCTSLTAITIPSNITSLGGRCFQNTRLVNVVLPSVTYIDQDAFSNNPALVSVSCPEVTGIVDGFRSCSALTTVSIPKVVSLSSSSEEYYGGTFIGCTSLVSITLPNTLTTMYANEGRGGGTFRGCTNLTNPTIPASVTSINGWTYLECPAITGVYFLGNKPSISYNMDFVGSVTVYYKPATTGWDTYSGNPTATW